MLLHNLFSSSTHFGSHIFLDKRETRCLTFHHKLYGTCSLCFIFIFFTFCSFFRFSHSYCNAVIMKNSKIFSLTRFRLLFLPVPFNASFPVLCERILMAFLLFYVNGIYLVANTDNLSMNLYVNSSLDFYMLTVSDI